MLLIDPTSHANKLFAIHHDGRTEELDSQLIVPDFVTTTYNESDAGDVTGAVLEDVLDGDGIQELVTLVRHRHFDQSVSRLSMPNTSQRASTKQRESTPQLCVSVPSISNIRRCIRSIGPRDERRGTQRIAPARHISISMVNTP